MTLAAVVAGGITPVVSGQTFPLTPHAVGDAIVIEVISTTAADYATALSSSNVTWDPSPVVAHTSLTANSVVATVFKGNATSTSTATVTVTVSGGSPTLRAAGQEFSTTLGYSSVTLDASGTVNSATTLCPSLTPGHGAGEAYFCFVFDAGSSTAGSTSGYSYGADANGNGLCYNAACGSGTQQPAFGASDTISGIAVLLYEAVTSFPGAATLSGSGTLSASGQVVVVPGAAVLAGSGTLAATAAVVIPAAVFLLGTGTLGASAAVVTPGGGAAVLYGTGTLTAGAAAGLGQAAVLYGTGTLTGTYTGLMLQAAVLYGTGALTATPAGTLQATAGLFGAGFLSIPQVAGGLVNGTGGASVPQAMAGSSQVAVAPPGSSNWQWLGTLGQVTALTYSYICPGGCDQMTCTIMVPAAYRTQLFNPGWQVKITRGGHQVWDGKMDEPQPSAQGWTLTAVGTGNLGQNFTAYFSVDDLFPVDEPDEILNRAIARGLPWANPGYNSSPIASQFWMGQAQDPGSAKVSDFLNLICTRGGLTWYVNSQPGGLYNSDDLLIFPLPTTPNRLLVSTTPVARTLAGDPNVIIARYMSIADNATASPPVAASYNVLSVQNAASVAAHQATETYIDLSDAGVLTVTQVQAVCNGIFQQYQRASFAGPFTVSYGQLLNTGGAPVDLATDQAGNVARLILTDFAYGGEVVPNVPISFVIGSYLYDDFAQTAQISPFQTFDSSLTGMLSAWNTVNTPAAPAGG